MIHMKRNVLYLFLIAALIINITSCTKDFDKINTDPNRIDQISPGTLLNPIIFNMASFNMQRADAITFNLMQVALPYPSATGGIHRYDIQESTGNSTWSTSYLQLNNVREMYNKAVQANDPNYKAIALTLKSWIYSNLTDCFGDVPMDEAVLGDDYIWQPKFNTQKEVYARMIADLDTANTIFNAGKAMLYGTDILYANNILKWKKFSNSLKMRILLRTSKRTDFNAYAEIRKMIDNPTLYPVFSTNDDAAALKLTGITPLASPWGRPVDFTTFRAAGKFFIDSLNSTNDPRRPKLTTMARNAAGTTTIGYQGIPSGFNASTATFNFIPSNVNQLLVTASATAPVYCPLMTYSEVELIKAEVELMYSKNNAAAKSAYEKGVKAAIEQWGLVVPADYFTNVNAAFNNSLQRIMLQKYYALYFVDYQQWFEYRRTGFPVMPTETGMLNNKVMPVRFKYPIVVRSNNPNNYNKAVLSIGVDDINTKLWWEK
jgi:hypothetical protein